VSESAWACVKSTFSALSNNWEISPPGGKLQNYCVWDLDIADVLGERAPLAALLSGCSRVQFYALRWAFRIHRKGKTKTRRSTKACPSESDFVASSSAVLTLMSVRSSFEKFKVTPPSWDFLTASFTCSWPKKRDALEEIQSEERRLERSIVDDIMRLKSLQLDMRFQGQRQIDRGYCNDLWTYGVGETIKESRKRSECESWADSAQVSGCANSKPCGKYLW